MLRALRAQAARDQKFLCYWCGEEMRTDVDDNHPRAVSGDHKIPKHNGGKTIPGNIVAAHRECNERRHPELNMTKEPRRLSAGDDTPRSPFEILRGRF
jgi:5-methylcytosine-specific restriction endonuclease McrA